MTEGEKKEIIENVVNQMRMKSNIEMISRVLTEGENKLRDKPNELVALIENNCRKANNARLAEILKVNEIIA